MINVDYFIQIVFVLLVLSMITEKIADFIKYKYPENGVKRFFVKDRSYKYAKTLEQLKEYKDDLRTKEIQTLTLLIGITVAFMCRANIFSIWNPDFELTWINVSLWDMTPYEFAMDVVGCLVTGVFLSFGSSFFHDLLGLLMETKSLKRKLKDRGKIEEVSTIGGVDAYMVQADLEPILVEKQVIDFARRIPNVQGYEYSEIDNTLDVYVPEMTEAEFQALDKVVKIKLADQQLKDVDINYIGI